MAEARQKLSEQLLGRRPEIESAVHARLTAVPDAPGVRDPEYAEGLRTAIGAAIDFGLAGIRQLDTTRLPIPIALLAQARLAARNGVGLNEVLSRYLAGYAELERFLSDEVQESGLLRGKPLNDLRNAQLALFERLFDTVAEEHRRETSAQPISSEQRRAVKVQRLLAGQYVDTSDLGYEFNDVHLGLITRNQQSIDIAKDLAVTLGLNFLYVIHGDEVTWGWVSSRRELGLHEFERAIASAKWPADVPFAVGTPQPGKDGWRRTHEQARAVLGISLRRPGLVTRYADQPLVASSSQDPVLSAWLRDSYLVPLTKEKDGGHLLRKTLRAYFAAGRNGASAAVSLGVSRQTVMSRLKRVERRVSRPLSQCGTELELALRLDALKGT